MSKIIVLLAICAVMSLAGAAWAAEATSAATAASPAWSFKGTAIEACSCPMFCQCYFNVQPAAHGHEGHEGHEGHAEADHYCRFNMAYRVDKGNYGATKL